MKNTTKFGFNFEKQGLSGNEGPIDPAQQYFEGSHADHAVVRETGQNTLDNRGRNASGPIRMVFELATMKTKDIPDIDQLRKHLEAVAKQTVGQQGHDRMVKAFEASKNESISVLRISDYNTTGLTGSESIASKNTPLSKLTRGKGGSSDDERGGSFGIGSAVGPMASDLCTVFYTSIPEDTKASVLAGYTRLATHSLDEINYRAEGYFTRTDLKNEFEYQRPAPQIGPFTKRTEVGTDIYILGYRMAETDPDLTRVRDAMIDNFMAAIKEGHLIVEGIAQGKHWTLDSETLPQLAKLRTETNAFYEALLDDDPAEEEIKNLGKVRLYINLDDRLDRKLHTITMRSPLMKIDTFRHNSISAKYAAVLICDSQEGNKYLRQLEPPQHHEWDQARNPASGKQVIQNLKTFVRESLKKRVTTEVGDEVKIEGLSRFLPTDHVQRNLNGHPASPTSKPNKEGTKTESSSVTGKPDRQTPSPMPSGKKVRVNIRRNATNLGEEDTKQGKKQGGEKKRLSNEVNLQGKGEKGDGSSRIEGRSLSFRSWTPHSKNKSNSVIAMTITANKEEFGDIELVALGTGGTPEDGYNLPILRAVQNLPEKSIEIEFSGNTLKNLKLESGQTIRLEIYLPSGERYRLGVA